MLVLSRWAPRWRRTLGFDPTPHIGALTGGAVVRYSVCGTSHWSNSPAAPPVMGGDTIAPTWVGWVVTVMVSLLSVMLIYLTLTG